MRNKLRSFTALFLALALLLTILPAAASAQQSAPALPADGVYEIPYQYLKDDGSGSTSSINNYAVANTGK
ncbi:hypothetical protein AB4Z21_33070, partial [Paenibacillus sp. MCAF20]